MLISTDKNRYTYIHRSFIIDLILFSKLKTKYITKILIKKISKYK